MGKISTKAIIFGFLCVIILSIYSPYSDLIIGTVWSGATFLPLNVITIFIILVLVVNTILRKLKIGLSETELLYIYCMMLVTGCIASLGLVHSLIPITTSIFYHATEENKWKEILHPHITKWFIPSNPDSIKFLWEGLPKGMSIPWSDWLRPFVGWVILALAMYLVMYSICLLLHKQWISNEKLVFPLTRLPLEMCKEEKGKLLPPFFRDKIMWIGFIIAAFPLLLNGLNYFFPIIPQIKLFTELDPFLREAPWVGLTPIRFNVIFSAIGLTFLLPESLAFSLWFFFFFFRAQAVLSSLMGFPIPMMSFYPTRSFIAYQIAGGMIIFCLSFLWFTRQEFKKIFLPGSESSIYRKALIGLLIGLLVIGLWSAFTGVSVVFTLGVFIIFFLIVLAATRLTAEGGVYFFQASFRPSDIIMAFTGSAALGTKNIVNIMGPVEFAFMRDQRDELMPSVMDTLKICDSGKLAQKKLILTCAGAILISIVVSFIAYLAFMYKIGGINCVGYTWSYGAWWGAAHTSRLLTTPQAPSITHIISLLVGSISMILILILRKMFIWFPLHPLGYIMGDSWPTIQLWFPIMLGWFFKVIVLRFGGITGYRKLMPGFLGLILGEYSMIGLWVIIDMLTGTRGRTVAPFL